MDGRVKTNDTDFSRRLHVYQMLIAACQLVLCSNVLKIRIRGADCRSAHLRQKLDAPVREAEFWLLRLSACLL